MAKQGAQTLTFKSVTNQQTDKWTDKLETVSIADPLQNRQHAQNPECCQQ